MKKSRRESEPISGTEGKKKGCSNLGCALFSLPFFLGGAAVIYFLFAGPAIKIFRAQSWNPTPCTIISSKVAGDGDTYSVEVVYSYTVAGDQYQSDRYDFVEASTSSREGKAEVVRQNPPGKSAICYVNPANPSDAVFSRSFSSDMWFGLFGLPFLLVGVVGFYVAARDALKARRGAKDLKAKPASPWPTFETTRYRNPSPTALNESDSQASSFPWDSPQPSSSQPSSSQPSSSQPGSSQPSSFQENSVQPAPFQERSFMEGLAQAASALRAAPAASLTPTEAFERVVLKPAITPGCKLTAVATFAAIWNGIVAATGGWSFERWDDGDLAWIPALFMSPFQLVGILLVIVAGYLFLAMFNPRPRLTLSPGKLRLGEPFRSGMGIFRVQSRRQPVPPLHRRTRGSDLSSGHDDDDRPLGLCHNRDCRKTDRRKRQRENNNARQHHALFQEQQQQDRLEHLRAGRHTILARCERGLRGRSAAQEINEAG